MRIRRLRINQIEYGKVAMADTFGLRLRGLMGRTFADFDALILLPCSSIHTCFMKYPIDVLFVGRTMKILKIEENVQPWTLHKGCSTSHLVVEFPAGKIKKLGIKTGDTLQVH